MFKSVISSLNGGGGHHSSSAPDAGQKDIEIVSNEEITSRTNNHDLSNSNHHHHHQQAQTQVQVKTHKKGGHRKRFSSMMNKFQGRVAALGSAGGSFRRSKDHKSQDGDNESEIGDDADRDDDDDDDDEEFLSAEEACRKMSLNEPSGGVPGAKYDAQASKQQMESYKQQEQRPSLSGSDKYILPEELSDIPTFLHTANCERALIDETRRLLKERYAKNPDNFYDADYERMLTDDWTVSRFLLRRRLDPRRTAKLMEECGRFRKQYRMSEVELWEFPIEFHKAGGLFQYECDRVGNVTMYMRIKMYRRVPEISDVFKAFILCVLERCDVTNNGRGTAVIFDLSGCGLQNVDLGFLSWLLSSFRNYCPKGVSYILVYNLPWILNATCKLAMTWMSASNKRALRFVYGAEIENFIPRENLPDYMGGTCKRNYRRVPVGSLPATEVCHRFDLTPAQALKIAELFKEYLDEDKYHVEYEERDGNGVIETKEERLRRQKEQKSYKQQVDSAKSTTKSTAALSPYGEATKALSELSQHQAAQDNGGQTSAVDFVSQATKFITH